LFVPEQQKEFLDQATSAYSSQVATAADYLKGRGITGTIAMKARLGVVVDPVPGDQTYLGRLAIPYITPTGVVDIRYRCLEPHSCKDHGHGKYLSRPGSPARLYNTTAFQTEGPVIGITEGELDALIVNHHLGIPCVAVPGAAAWKEYYWRIFEDFSLVHVFADGDKAGEDFADRVMDDLDNAAVVRMPHGMDVTDVFRIEEVDGLLHRIAESTVMRFDA
jgi:hypothetical protein